MISHLQAVVGGILLVLMSSTITGAILYWRGRAAQVKEFFELNEAGVIKIQYLGGKADIRSEPSPDERGEEVL